MKTTRQISSNPKTQAARAILFSKVGMYRVQTEACLFSLAKDQGIPESNMDDAIGEMLDGGWMRSTIIGDYEVGFHAALVGTGK